MKQQIVVAMLAVVLAAVGAAGTAGAQDLPTASYPQCLQETFDGASYICQDDCAFTVPTLSDVNAVFASNGGAGSCRAGAASGTQGIGPDDSATWTFGDSAAQDGLSPYAACAWTDTSSAVSLTGGFSEWSSSISATNWDPTSSHNWSGGMDLITGGGGGGGQYQIPSTSGFTGSCANGNGCILDQVSITSCCQNPPPNFQPPLCPTPVNAVPSLASILAAALEGTARKQPVTHTRAASSPGVTTRTATSYRPRTLRLRCPAGSQLLDASSAMVGRAVHLRPQVATSATGASTSVDALAPHELVRLQILCRAAGQSVTRTSARLIFAGERNDVLALTRQGQTVFAGNGGDTIRSRRRDAVILAGNGDDTVTVSGADDVAQGGSGADVLVAAGSGRALLIGGVGRDLLVARHGSPHLNAADGQAGDTVLCQPGTRAVVRADHGDAIYGACAEVHWA